MGAMPVPALRFVEQPIPPAIPRMMRKIWEGADSGASEEFTSDRQCYYYWWKGAVSELEGIQI